MNYAGWNLSVYDVLVLLGMSAAAGMATGWLFYDSLAVGAAAGLVIFFLAKPRYIRWFYRLASYAVAPLSVIVFNNANTIPVYRDARILTTLRTTMNHLVEGANVVIFPECDEKFNNILYQFQEGFVDVARLYLKKTGKELCFVPMYIAPKLRQMHFGNPVRFCGENPIDQERRRICDCMKEAITQIAASLPLHTVVPYRNIPKRDYPMNIPIEVNNNEKTGG